METIFVKGLFRNSRILVGEHLNQLSGYLPETNVFIITDANVHRIYSADFPDYPVFVMHPGEQSKTTDSAVAICQWLMEQGAGRDAFLLGIGGGMVCDMTGFVASVYMRGIPFAYVATSLLAQVDASIGGKTGVNLDGYKNLVGTFNQPLFVLCDTTMLASLPETELRNGLAEAVKHTLIADKRMFFELIEKAEAILDLNENLLEKLVSHSIKVKADIVCKDEVEQGERRKLNLGHTWGHAVEKIDRIPHGQAVSIGLVFAAALSEQKGLLSMAEKEQIEKLLVMLGLPVSTSTDPALIMDALTRDKKKEADFIHFVLIDGIGKVRVEPIPISEIETFALGR